MNDGLAKVEVRIGMSVRAESFVEKIKIDGQGVRVRCGITCSDVVAKGKVKDGVV